MTKHLKDMSIEELRQADEKRRKKMNNGDKVMVYAADNRWHECIYICESYANKGHHIIYKDGKPYECANEMIKPIKDN